MPSGCIVMKQHIVRLTVGAMLLSCTAIAGTIQYSVTDVVTPMSVGDPVRRFTYTISGFSLEPYQEIEIRFSPSDFVSISNPTGDSPLFSVLVLAVNNPPGALGTYSIMSLADNPPLGGLFSLDAVLIGDVPPSLPYYLNQLDPGTFEVLEQLSSGTAFGVSGVPEPSPAGYTAIGLVLLALVRLRHLRNTKSE
jgi:hypothetical protein